MSGNRLKTKLDLMDFTEALQLRMDEMAAACTQCGKCFEACPMVDPIGLANEDPRLVLAGIVEQLRGGEGSAASEKWAAACSGSGYCISACDYAVNPRSMLKLANYARVVREGGDRVRKNAIAAFRGMAQSLRTVSRLQLTSAQLAALEDPGPLASNEPADITLYTGCNLYKSPHILVLVLEVLRHMDVTCRLVGGPSACCGINQFRAGDGESSGRAGLSTLKKIEKQDSREKISWCPSCQSQFEDVIIPNLNKIEPENNFQLEMFFVWLERRLDQLIPLFKYRVEKRVALNERPGYPRVMTAVKKILSSIPGVEVVELDVPRVGLMSNYLSVTPNFKTYLRDTEFHAAAEAEVTTLATVFHACHREICEFDGVYSFEIINVMEIIGESMGLHADDIYKLLKVHNSADELLEYCSDLIAEHGLDASEAFAILTKEQAAKKPLQGKILEDASFSPGRYGAVNADG